MAIFFGSKLALLCTLSLQQLNCSGRARRSFGPFRAEVHHMQESCWTRRPAEEAWRFLWHAYARDLHMSLIMEDRPNGIGAAVPPTVAHRATAQTCAKRNITKNMAAGRFCRLPGRARWSCMLFVRFAGLSWCLPQGSHFFRDPRKRPPGPPWRDWHQPQPCFCC